MSVRSANGKILTRVEAKNTQKNRLPLKGATYFRFHSSAVLVALRYADSHSLGSSFSELLQALCYAALLDIDDPSRLFLYGRIHLRQLDVQNTVRNTCRDLVLIHIVRQQQRLLETTVRELVADVVALGFLLLIAVGLALFLVLFGVVVLALALLLQQDYQLVLVVDMNREVVLRHTRSGYLYMVSGVVFQYIDGGRVVCGTNYRPFITEKVVK